MVESLIRLEIETLKLVLKNVCMCVIRYVRFVIIIYDYRTRNFII